MTLKIFRYKKNKNREDSIDAIHERSLNKFKNQNSDGRIS